MFPYYLPPIPAVCWRGPLLFCSNDEQQKGSLFCLILCECWVRSIAVSLDLKPCRTSRLLLVNKNNNDRRHSHHITIVTARTSNAMPIRRLLARRIESGRSCTETTAFDDNGGKLDSKVIVYPFNMVNLLNWLLSHNNAKTFSWRIASCEKGRSCLEDGNMCGCCAMGSLGKDVHCYQHHLDTWRSDVVSR